MIWPLLVAQRLTIEPKRERWIAVEPLRVLQRDDAVRQDDPVRELSEGGRAAAIARACAVEHSLRGERDDAGVPVIGLHELLDAEGHAIDEPELLRDVFLIPESQPVLLAAGAQVQKIADAPEHLAGVLELSDLARQKSPGADVVLLVARSPASPCGPFGHIQISQAAAALLHVGLEKIKAASEATVAGPGVLLERTEEVDQVRLEDLLARAALEVVEQCAAAGDAPEVDQRRGGADVLASQAQHLVDASNGMPDVDAEIPQGVEQPSASAPTNGSSESSQRKTTSTSLFRPRVKRP